MHSSCSAVWGTVPTQLDPQRQCRHNSKGKAMRALNASRLAWADKTMKTTKADGHCECQSKPGHKEATAMMHGNKTC